MKQSPIAFGIVLLFASVCLGVAALGATSRLELIPEGRPFRLAIADPGEIRMALLVQGDSRIMAHVGNYFSLLALPKESPEGAVVHFGVEGGGAFSLRKTRSRFPLEHTDGLLGLYLEGERQGFIWQARYTHVSSHLSDGIEGRTPIPYSREYVQWKLGYTSESSFLYGGVQYLVNTVPDVPRWGAQLGGVYFSKWRLGKLTPFAALDIRLRQESDYNPSVSAQLGVAVNNPPASYESFRVFYSYYSGSDPRGQFFRQSLTYHALGIEMQI